MADVIVHGAWYSPFYYRVLWALKLKGIEFEYVEEDLKNKSPALLKYNPVHKKIPVLVHNGHPVCESMVIVEYIDQIWPENPLLPGDHLERARARFWLKYLDDKFSVFTKLVFRPEKDLKNVTEEIHELLATMEEHLVRESAFLGGDKIGILDIAYGTTALWVEAFEEVAGVEKLIVCGKYSGLHAWLVNIKAHPVIMENVPDKEELLCFLKILRQTRLSS